MVLPQWAIHRDGRQFEDPLAFRPGRWLERRPAETPAFFPFGAGSRACIGRTLARGFDVEVHAHELELDAGITLRLEGPVEGRVRPRSW